MSQAYTQPQEFDSTRANGVAPGSGMVDLIDLHELATNIYAERWRIILVTLVVGILASLFYLNSTPSYTAAALVRIEPEITTAGELTAIDTEIDIISSWSTVSETLDQMERNAEVFYTRSPFMLRLDAFRRQLSGQNVFTDFNQLWGTPVLRLKAFTVPEAYLNQAFTLRVESEGGYVLYSPSGEKLLQGEVLRRSSAELYHPSAATMEAPLEILVSSIEAPVGAEFVIIPRARMRFIDDARQSLAVLRKGFRNSSGLIELSFTSHDPAYAEAFLTRLVDTYTQKAFDRSAIGKIKSLQNLDQRLQTLLSSIEDAEKALANFRTRENIVDIPLEARLVLQNIVKLEEQINQLKVRKHDLGVTHGVNHPAIIAIDEQLQFLRGKMAEYEQDVARMPELERHLIELTRAVDSYNRLYQINLEKRSQLKTEVEGITGYARVINEPMVLEHMPFKRMVRYFTVGAIIGLFISGFYVFIRSLPMFAPISRAEQLAMNPMVPLVAVVPHITRKNDAKTNPLILHRKGNKALEMLEHIQSKWNFITYGARNNVTVFTSLDQNQGKTFLVANLSSMISEHRRTIIVDADLARKDTHYPFGQKRSPGLSDVIVGDVELKKAITTVVDQKLWFLPPGTQTLTNAMLHDSDKMEKIMEALSKHFDTVIVDYPALSLHHDLRDLLRFAGCVILVVRQGSPASRIKQLLRRYPRGIAPVNAMIMNDASTTKRPDPVV